MAAPTERVTISDFRPGIFSSEMFRSQLLGDADQSLGDVMQPGAATLDGTYGCVADSTGALIPLPAKSVEDSTTGVGPNGGSSTFVPSDTLGANYLLGVELSGPWGDFYGGNLGEDVLTHERRPYQTLYTLWGITANIGGTPKCATHGFYKVRQPRIKDAIGEYHTFYFFIEDMFGDGGTQVSRQFPFASFVKMRTNTWGKPDYGTRWPVFNAGTFEQTIIALVEGIRVLDDLDAGEKFSAATMNNLFHLGNGSEWFHPAGSFPTATRPDPNFGFTTDSHMTIIGHYGTDWGDRSHTAGVKMWNSTAGGTLVRGGWSAHFRDQSIVSFFKSMPFRVRHAVHHQGRLVMVSRRELFTSDEVLLYSDWLAPLQYTDDLSQNIDGEGNTIREFGWDDKFFPPAIRDFPHVASPWNMGTYNGASINTAAYRAYMASRPYNLLLPGDDSLGRTCSMGTAASGQLFLIKDQGGAVLIDGDLDNPTVKVAPNVEPTYGVESTGVHTPLGYVYGSRTGVYAWGGGDEARHLSPQMEGFFWDHATEAETNRYLGSRGSFQYWDQKIICPNDYLLDTVSNSWWRLEPNGADIPASRPRNPYNRYLIDIDGNLWAFAYKVTPNAHDYAFSYTSGTYRSSYSWRSQPLVVSDDHIVSVQDVELTVTPTPGMKIVVTLSGYTYDAANSDGSGRLGVSKTSRTVTFAASSAYDVAVKDTQPIKLRQDVGTNFAATQISAAITASSSPNVAAPTIHSMSFGIGKRTRVPRLGGRTY